MWAWHTYPNDCSNRLQYRSQSESSSCFHAGGASPENLRSRGHAIWIARGYDVHGNLDGPTYATQVPVSQYDEIVVQVESYFRENTGN